MSSLNDWPMSSLTKFGEINRPTFMLGLAHSTTTLPKRIVCPKFCDFWGGFCGGQHSNRSVLPPDAHSFLHPSIPECIHEKKYSYIHLVYFYVSLYRDKCISQLTQLHFSHPRRGQVRERPIDSQHFSPGTALSFIAPGKERARILLHVP